MSITLGEPGDLGCGKQLDYIMVPKDLRSTTWYLIKVRLRTWDHFPVVVKIEEKDLGTRKGVKSWAGWTPRSEVEISKFQELMLCSSDGRTEIRKYVRDGLTALQERLGRSGGCDQGYHVSRAEQDQIHSA